MSDRPNPWPLDADDVFQLRKSVSEHPDGVWSAGVMQRLLDTLDANETTQHVATDRDDALENLALAEEALAQERQAREQAEARLAEHREIVRQNDNKHADCHSELQAALAAERARGERLAAEILSRCTKRDQNNNPCQDCQQVAAPASAAADAPADQSADPALAAALAEFHRVLCRPGSGCKDSTCPSNQTTGDS